VGTRGGGLNRLTDGPATAYTTVEGLTSDQVYPILEDRSGALWLGTAGGGLNRIEGGRITAFGTRDGLSSDRVYALCQDRSGTLWAGTSDGALNRFDGRQFHTVKFQGTSPSHRVACIAEGPRGRLWVGTRGGGLWVREGGNFEQVCSGSEPPGWGIYAIFFSKEGTLWLGTSEGLYRLSGKTFVPLLQEPDLGHEKVFAICEDGRGSLWMATYGGGLVRVRDGRARRITGTDGLGSSTFYQVIEDGRGGLWFTGNAGIRVASLKHLDAFAEGRAASVSVRVLGIEDGLKTLECNGGVQPAGCLARNGSLWFPTARGAVEVNPERLSDRKALFPARIERVLVNGRHTAPGAAMTLPRGEGALEFGFSVPSLLNPRQIQVQYLLEGFDREWVDAGPRRAAYYTNVPAGRYVFRVKDGSGHGEGAQAAVALFLAPPFYRHPFFLAALCLLLAGGAVGAYRLRVNFIMRRSRVLEETVARRTAELTVEKDHVFALEERYRVVVEDQKEMICRFAPDGTLTLANGAMGRCWGVEPSTLQGRNLFELLPEEGWRGARQALGTLTPQAPIRVDEEQVRASDGTLRIHQWSIRAIFDSEGRLIGFQGVGRDVTERRRMGEQLLQAQKMEAVGRLAGGVAHDFNNLLQAMLSASGTLRRTCGGCDKGTAALKEVEEDIQRAAQLTRQLLLFSHKETAKPEMLDLNAVVKGVEGLLKRLLRENISSLLLPRQACPFGRTRPDGQAIVNLVVNACDAMPVGGQLVLPRCDLR
jgi:PAS domain S-box-containing protein